MKRYVACFLFAAGVAATLPSFSQEEESGSAWGEYDFGEGLVGLDSIQEFQAAMLDAKSKIESITSAAAKQKAQIEQLWNESVDLVNGLKTDIGKLEELVKEYEDQGGFLGKKDWENWQKDEYDQMLKDMDEKLSKKKDKDDADDLSSYLKKTDAQSTYLAKTDAQSTYLAKTDADGKYASKATADAQGDRISSLENREYGVKVDGVSIESNEVSGAIQIVGFKDRDSAFNLSDELLNEDDGGESQIEYSVLVRSKLGSGGEESYALGYANIGSISDMGWSTNWTEAVKSISKEQAATITDFTTNMILKEVNRDFVSNMVFEAENRNFVSNLVLEAEIRNFVSNMVFESDNRNFQSNLVIVSENRDFVSNLVFEAENRNFASNLLLKAEVQNVVSNLVMVQDNANFISNLVIEAEARLFASNLNLVAENRNIVSNLIFVAENANFISNMVIDAEARLFQSNIVLTAENRNFVSNLVIEAESRNFASNLVIEAENRNFVSNIVFEAETRQFVSNLVLEAEIKSFLSNVVIDATSRATVSNIVINYGDSITNYYYTIGLPKRRGKDDPKPEPDPVKPEDDPYNPEYEEDEVWDEVIPIKNARLINFMTNGLFFVANPDHALDQKSVWTNKSGVAEMAGFGAVEDDEEYDFYPTRVYDGEIPKVIIVPTKGGGYRSVEIRYFRHECGLLFAA